MVIYIISDNNKSSQYRMDFINREGKQENHDYSKTNKVTNLKLGNLKIIKEFIQSVIKPHQKIRISL